MEKTAEEILDEVAMEHTHPLCPINNWEEFYKTYGSPAVKDAIKRAMRIQSRQIAEAVRQECSIKAKVKAETIGRCSNGNGCSRDLKHYSPDRQSILQVDIEQFIK